MKEEMAIILVGLMILPVIVLAKANNISNQNNGLNQVSTTCSWCGYECLSLANRQGKMCPMIMPPSDWKCVLQNSQCVVQKPRSKSSSV